MALQHRTLWVALGLQAARAQHTLEEAACLTRWARGRRQLLEIGVAEGASALILRQAMDPNGDLWLIDPFHLSRNPLFNTGLMAARRTIKRGNRGQVHFLVGWSHEVAKWWRNPLDFLFIDGDHRYDVVLADWKGFSSWVKTGGVVTFHDAVGADGNFPGPVQLINKYLRDGRTAGWRIVEETGSIVAVRRET